MNLKTRADRIRKILKERYPDVKTPLLHETPFQLLVATILSAQCTDMQVNRVTGKLFNRFKIPEDFAAAPLKSIEAFIRPTGFFHNKARNIKNCSRALLVNHKGKVPETLEELIELPGVGRKTANVILGAVFGKPGIVVDTHVGRISRRLELTDKRDPVKIEFDLMKIMPKREWSDFSLRLIFFGREICTARNPKCPTCPINNLCPWKFKTT